MMESFDVDCGGRCRESFETDEFYESIEAPKFYDFRAPKEPIDPDAWFDGNPGMAKKVTEVLRAVHNPKIQKIVMQEVDSKAKDGHNSLPGRLYQSHSKIPVPEKAVSAAGGAKSHQGFTSVSASPLTSKPSRNGTNVHNSPSNHPILVEKLSGALKSTSVMKTWQPSENDDPNPATGVARNSPAVTPSKPGKKSRKPPPAVLPGHFPASSTTDVKHAEGTLPSSQPQTTTVVAKENNVLRDGGSNILMDGNSVDQSCAGSSPFKKEIPSKAAGVMAVKAQKSNHDEARSSPAGLHRTAPQEHGTLGTAATCKTPIKEPASKVLEDCSEHKKLTTGNELNSSPYSGHHCRSSRCAANDPNYSSPASIPRKKYLMARQGTPGCRALFGSVRTNPEYQEAAKVQNHLQQTKYPSDITMSEDKVLKNDNLDEVVVAVADSQSDQKDMDVQKTLDMEQLQQEPSKESEQPLSEHIVQMVKAASDPLCDQKDMGVQKTLDVEQLFPKLAVKDLQEGCNPTDMHHAVVQKENSKESARPLSEHLCKDLQESSSLTDMLHAKVQEAIPKESRTPISEHLTVQDTQDSCNPSGIKTDLQLGEGQEVCSVKDSGSEERTCTKALIMVNNQGPSTGALFGVSHKDIPSSLEEQLSIEDHATRPSSKEIENQGVMDKVGKGEQQPMPMVPFLSQSGRKRKSQKLEFEGCSKKANCLYQVLSKHTEIYTTKAVSGGKTKPRKKSTNPRPFRLRTQERGALKEIEFSKKMEEYVAAREGFLSAFQGLSVLEPWVIGKPPRQGTKDPIMQPSHHVFSAKRAGPSKKVPEYDSSKKNDKQTMIHAHKLPTFDHPFKPHRSTKKLTVPQEFKFHAINGRRTCPLHSQ